MKMHEYVKNACLKYTSAIDMAVERGMDYGMLIDYIIEDDVKKKDLVKWLIDYFREALDGVVEGGGLTVQEGQELFSSLFLEILEAEGTMVFPINITE